MHVDLADVSRAKIAVRLRGERVGRAGIVVGLSRKRGGWHYERRTCPCNAGCSQKRYSTHELYKAHRSSGAEYSRGSCTYYGHIEEGSRALDFLAADLGLLGTAVSIKARDSKRKITFGQRPACYALSAMAFWVVSGRVEENAAKLWNSTPNLD
jgi:hypothetical protein